MVDFEAQLMKAKTTMGEMMNIVMESGNSKMIDKMESKLHADEDED